MKISGNTILITGGTSGIGLELAKQLGSRGNKIIVTGRDQDKLEKAKQQLPGLQIIRSDVSNPRDIDALYSKILKEFPETNILINNAGIMRNINIQNSPGTQEDLTREIEINLNGPIRMTKIFLPHLKTKPVSAIVNVTSGLAFVPLPTSPVYCATKAGLHSFTLSLRVQLQKTNVKVFELAPPATATELLANTSSPEDLKGVQVMEVTKMVSVGIRGIENDQYEIRPGQSNQLKMMSRLAPNFILKQLSKPFERSLAM